MHTLPTARTARQTPPRPLGVWLLTGANALFAGLFPIIGDLALFLRGPGLPGGLPALLLGLALSLALLGASALAWAGGEQARRAMLALVAAFYGLTIVSSLIAMAGGLSSREQAAAFAPAVRAAFWLGLNLWYFTRPAVRAWYAGR